VLPEENRENVIRFLSEHQNFEAVDFTVGGRESEGGMLSLSPDTDGTDGFFIAKMRRRG
jgi:16S rRNA (cytosine967-C5)-methyltransferase